MCRSVRNAVSRRAKVEILGLVFVGSPHGRNALATNQLEWHFITHEKERATVVL
jgi:hypothetical protein